MRFPDDGEDDAGGTEEAVVNSDDGDSVTEEAGS